jgi:hypothetical protein
MDAAQRHFLEHRSELKLPCSVRVLALVRLFSGAPLDEFVEQLSPDQLVALQNFIWEKTVEIGLRIKGPSFSKKEITERMTATPAYQRTQGCSERTYYCKAAECLFANPDCARKKLREQLQAIQKAVQQWLMEHA